MWFNQGREYPHRYGPDGHSAEPELENGDGISKPRSAMRTSRLHAEGASRDILVCCYNPFPFLFFVPPFGNYRLQAGSDTLETIDILE